tara:strand:+ start:556 stop:723 length:168 start_codon:yes stop_codon:yes gene_type:complete
MLNLVSNALKFTSKGAIKINASIFEEETVSEGILEKKKMLSISVEDSGIGISKAN